MFPRKLQYKIASWLLIGALAMTNGAPLAFAQDEDAPATTTAPNGVFLPMIVTSSVDASAVAATVANAQANATDVESVTMQSSTIAFTDISITDNRLVATVQWAGDEQQPRSAVMLIQDAHGNTLDQTEVSLAAGQETSIVFANGIGNPWGDQGWVRRVVVQGDAETLTMQTFDLSLYCAVNENNEDQCVYEIYPGAESDPNVVHLSSDLDEALTALEAEAGAQDLLALVAIHYPELRGETYVYANQIARLPRLRAGCDCHWERVIQRDPPLAQPKAETKTGAWTQGMEGPGAAHRLHAHADSGRLRVHEIPGSVKGKTTLTLRLRCQRVEGPFTKFVWVQGPDGQWYIDQILYYRFFPCPVDCPVTFHHIGRYSSVSPYVWTGSGGQRPANRALLQEKGTYSANRIPVFSASTGNDMTRPVGFDITGGSPPPITFFPPSFSPSLTTELATEGYTRAVGRSHSADAKLANSYGMAIHGYASCVFPTDAVTWDRQSYENRTGEMCQTINTFFAQFFLRPYCQ
ncbi:MAG: hypothetical protein ACOYNY_36225 [Caldilineaceae bacterium]